VQVVSEQVDQVDGVVPGVGAGVPREQHEGDVADPLAGPGVRVLQSHRRLLIAEQYGWCGGLGLPSLPELSHEDLAEDDVAGVLEDGGEDDGDPVGLGLHVHRLVIAVVDHGLGLTLLASLLHNNLSKKMMDLKC